MPLLLCVLGDEPSAAHRDAVQLQDRIDGPGVSRLIVGKLSPGAPQPAGSGDS